MLFIKLIRFLCGYVRFRAKGGFPERFINLCSKENIPLWDISGSKGEMYAKTTIRGYTASAPARANPACGRGWQGGMGFHSFCIATSAELACFAAQR